MKEDTVRAGEGGVIELKVYVTGSPTPDVYWRKGRSDDIDTRQGKYIIVDDSSLMVLIMWLFGQDDNFAYFEYILNLYLYMN